MLLCSRQERKSGLQHWCLKAVKITPRLMVSFWFFIWSTCALDASMLAHHDHVLPFSLLQLNETLFQLFKYNKENLKKMWWFIAISKQKVQKYDHKFWNKRLKDELERIRNFDSPFNLGGGLRSKHHLQFFWILNLN